MSIFSIYSNNKTFEEHRDRCCVPFLLYLLDDAIGYNRNSGNYKRGMELEEDEEKTRGLTESGDGTLLRLIEAKEPSPRSQSSITKSSHSCLSSSSDFPDSCFIYRKVHLIDKFQRMYRNHNGL